ncbi:hypothetical protein EVAR_98815_1 [Eumeta japonica]|uniref:Uncharacterized protein n=1 Tax=Eumeta variegata TaxID=151549 RepID=A0A4C2A7Q0_EUMVA|nr:hypothetical protein EVAR_98815_1 [Eumeta japonica]
MKRWWNGVCLTQQREMKTHRRRVVTLYYCKVPYYDLCVNYFPQTLSRYEIENPIVDHYHFCAHSIGAPTPMRRTYNNNKVTIERSGDEGGDVRPQPELQSGIEISVS